VAGDKWLQVKIGTTEVALFPIGEALYAIEAAKLPME
jgi:hypothetical protein